MTIPALCGHLKVVSEALDSALLPHSREQTSDLRTSCPAHGKRGNPTEVRAFVGVFRRLSSAVANRGCLSQTNLG